MSNFNLCEIFRSIFIRKHKPISVANEQCGTVGLNSTRTCCITKMHEFIQKNEITQLLKNLHKIKRNVKLKKRKS